MKESKIEYANGIIKQKGYPEEKCRFVKANINRKDEFADRPLYVLPNINIKEDIVAVTPSVLEALGREERKTIGIINDNGDVLVPMNNTSIIIVNNKYIACNQYNPNNKMDPTKFQETITSSQEIKDKMRTLVPDIEFKCDNYNSKYDLYEIEEDNTLEKVFEGASYIATSNETVYVHTNDPIEETVVFGEKKEEIKMDTNIYEQAPISSTKIITDEPQIQMPVSTFAVNSHNFDNLDVTGTYPQIKPGAPDLIEKSEETAPYEEEPADTKTNDIKINDTKENNTVEPVVSVDYDKQVEPTFEKPTPTEMEIAAKTVVEPETKEKITEAENPFKVTPGEKSSQLADITGLVSAVKNKFTNNEKEIAKKEEEINSKEEEIAKLQARNKELEEANKKMQDEYN